MNNYKHIITIECGSTMKDKHDKLVQNTCFFNSFILGILQVRPELELLNYSDLLQIGGWKQTFRGTMVDTYVHAEHIENLARFFKCKIGVYSEILPGITNSTVYNVYGVEGSEVSIVKLKDAAHFNLMAWNPGHNMIEEDRLLAVKIFEQMQIEEQIRVEQLKAERAKQIHVDHRLALRLQESEDHKMALRLQKIF